MLSHNTQHANKKNTKMRASASATPQAATIHDEESPTMGEVSDVIDSDTTVVDNDELRHEQRRWRGDTFASSSEQASV